jgi:uncharacterized membrane protein
MKHALLKEHEGRLAASLWVLPALSGIGAVLAAKLLTLLDRGRPQREEAWYLFGGQADSARELLSTIASSLMTFTGVVFSISILVLQQASSQFSSRVLRAFLEDRFTKVAMATFIGSFVYAMALLPEVRGPSPADPSFVPALAIFVAFVLVLLSVGVFVRYIHHMAHAIRAIAVVRRISAATHATIEELFPIDPADEPPSSSGSPPAEEGARLIPSGPEPGVVASVDEAGLLDLAVRHDLVVVLIPHVGEFVPRRAPLLRVWAPAPLPEDVEDRLRRSVVITSERTAHQDPAFGFRQLVDIAERALSPGVNDPTTAVQALDEIHDLLRSLAPRHFPPTSRADEAGRTRLFISRPDWDDFVHLAIDEIRQYGEGSIQVVRRIRALLHDVLGVAPPARRPVLEEQLRLLDAAVGRGFSMPRERELARSPDAHDA